MTCVTDRNRFCLFLRRACPLFSWNVPGAVDDEDLTNRNEESGWLSSLWPLHSGSGIESCSRWRRRWFWSDTYASVFERNVLLSKSRYVISSFTRGSDVRCVYGLVSLWLHLERPWCSAVILSFFLGGGSNFFLVLTAPMGLCLYWFSYYKMCSHFSYPGTRQKKLLVQLKFCIDAFYLILSGIVETLFWFST